MSDTKRARYTLEFKMEAVRLVRGGQVAAVTAKVLGIPKQTLENRAIDKFIKRERRCVRHEVLVTDVQNGTLYFREVRDILSR